ncbi:MAG: Holliday junction branch migration protein RuvA [Treponema sp.]|nr:Holliday junction branch migration protein RuvA [Treponema sp.]MBQ1713398.1 Holliday junction branch migration protein RuvA [Treponema sp.]MBR4246913.1 Holliday junction branch migration protein RuvA [Treponema sp.]
MFNSFTGTITFKGPQKLCIDTHGIEWELTVPESSLLDIPPVGQEGRVYTWLQHTDALMNLYGFASESDRELFLNLLKVDGIGPKGAVKIMSNISATDLASVLESGDVDRLQKVPGVGKKTAGKMLLALKGKLSLSEDSSVSLPKKDALPFADVALALSNMGYDKKTAEAAVAKIAGRLAEDPSFASQSQVQKEEFVFRQAIVELA